MRRVVVTGIGVIAPGGNDADALFASLVAGRSALRPLDAPWARGLSGTCAGTVDDATLDATFPKPRRLTMDRVAMLGVFAAQRAMAAASPIVDEAASCRAGVFWGTGMGGAHAIEAAYRDLLTNPAARLRPTTVVMAMNNATAGQIAMQYGLHGPSLTYSTACSSSAVAIGEAFRAIRAGIVDLAIAGGSEALLTEGVVKSWASLGTLARTSDGDAATACRPFAQDRSGFLLGEAGAALVLEDAESAQRRGACILAEVLGYGNATDARHITNPDAGGQARAMRLALAEAQLAPGDIAYINAHGTATRAGDIVETAAIKSAFGEAARTIPISATKSMHGHLMGATGAVEFIVAVEALRRSMAPPTAHLWKRDPDCDLDYVPLEPRRLERPHAVMSNSFGFGGTNAVLVAGRYG